MRPTSIRHFKLYYMLTVLYAYMQYVPVAVCIPVANSYDMPVTTNLTLLAKVFVYIIYLSARNSSIYTSAKFVQYVHLSAFL